MTMSDPRPPVVAIGDVHGCATLLREAVWPHLGSGAELIFLGDLIDRSPEPDRRPVAGPIGTDLQWRWSGNQRSGALPW